MNNHIMPPTTEHTKRPRYMVLETQVLAWDMQTNVAELNRLMDPSPPLLDNWISRDNTDMNKQ